MNSAAEALQVGPYQLLEPLAQGGMAHVWVGERVDRPGQRVALKLLRPGTDIRSSRRLRMFLDEARIGAMLAHPNLVRVFDVGVAGTLPYLAMELLEGCTVAELLDGKPMPIGLVAAVALEVLAGLEYAHSATDSRNRPLRIVHRDIKPSNLYITRDGGVRVLDFGIAQVSGRTSTTEGTVPGSLPYCAPEQLQEEGMDARADLFSLAVVLHEMLTGQRVFDKRAPTAIIQAIAYATVPPVSTWRTDVPPALDRAIAKALAKAPGDRPQTAAALAKAIAEAVPDAQRWKAPDLARWLAERRSRASSTASIDRVVAAANLHVELRGARPVPPRRASWLLVVPAAILGAAALGVGLWPQAASRALGKHEASAGRGVGAGTDAPGAGPERLEAADPQDGRRAEDVARVQSEKGVNPRHAPGGHAPTEGTIEKGVNPPHARGVNPPTERTLEKGVSQPRERGVHPPTERAIDVAQSAALAARGSRRPAAGARGQGASASSTGLLSIDSRPGWAHVWVDGQALGPTPLYRRTVPVGVHRIEARSPSGATQTRTVVVERGGERTVILVW